MRPSRHFTCDQLDDRVSTPDLILFAIRDVSRASGRDDNCLNKRRPTSSRPKGLDWDGVTSMSAQ
jgi:hypothetical protein